MIVVVDASTGRVVTGPEIHAKGVAEGDHVFDDVKPKILNALTEASNNGVRDQYELQQVIRRAIGSWVGQKLRRKAMIVPVVVEA